MNDTEILSWLGSLSPRPEVQAYHVKVLLRNASEDRLSSEDRTVCVRALKLLEGVKVQRSYHNYGLARRPNTWAKKSEAA